MALNGWKDAALGEIPTDAKIGLHTGDPGAAGTANEVSGNGYARTVCGGWDAVEDGTGDIRQKKNTNAIQFPDPTGAWGTVTHYTIWNNGESTVYEANALDASVAPTTGSPFIFGAGKLIVQAKTAT